MTDVGIRLDGMRQLRAALKRAGADMTDLRTANRAVIDIVRPAAQAGAPRRSGNLAKATRGRASRTRAAIVNKAIYANPIHWGWGRRNIAANPWISRAATRTESTWLNAYLTHINNILEKVARS